MQDMPPILVAEDDDDDFYFLRRAIRQAEIENPLLRFRDGSELIKFLEQLPAADSTPTERPSWLLLLDITMPLMNGFEVLQWLQAHEEQVRVRPVMLSGSYRPDDIERAIGLGAVDYLIKPITAPILAQVAAKQLGGSLAATSGLDHLP